MDLVTIPDGVEGHDEISLDSIDSPDPAAARLGKGFFGLEDPTRVAAELPDEELIAAFAIPIRPESPMHCALMAPMPTLAFV